MGGGGIPIKHLRRIQLSFQQIYVLGLQPRFTSVVIQKSIKLN